MKKKVQNILSVHNVHVQMLSCRVIVITSYSIHYTKLYETKGKGQKRLARFFLSFDDIDWSRTLAYSLGNAGQLWINLKGREPGGIVSPGIEYDAVRKDLIGRLKSMSDPETGQNIVDEVYSYNFV